MQIFKVVIIILVIAYGIAYIYFLSKIKKPIRFLLYQAVISFIVMLIINLTSFATKLYIPVNYGTVLGSLSGGVPFLALVLLIKFIFSI